MGVSDRDPIVLRPATPEDSELAYRVKEAAFRVYVERAKARDEEDQRRQHDRRFVEQDFEIVERRAEPVGVIATVVYETHLKLNQLMVHPGHQGEGLGEQCMIRILQRARSLGIPVRLQCMRVNPRALAFYDRLGFRVIGEDETHLLLQGE